MKYELKLAVFLLLSFIGTAGGCSCEPEQQVIPAIGIDQGHGQNNSQKESPAFVEEENSPQPAPKITGKTDALLPPGYISTFKVLGHSEKIYYTQFSAALVKDSYFFTIEAKTRGSVKGEKQTQQVPPYLKLTWRVPGKDIAKIADMVGTNLPANCVLLLGSEQWASSSNATVSIDEVTDTSVVGHFEGAFKFVDGALLGRTFIISEGKFLALISRAVPRNIR